MEHFISTWGYAAIFVLTVLEACCIPIPSEVTLGLAGALAGGAVVSGSNPVHLDLWAVIVVGIAGELVGSSIAYAVGRTGGRSLVDRVGKYVLLTHKDLDRAEAWFDRHGDPTVLFGRLLPLVRAFVSLPAGMAEMNIPQFGLFSFIGIAIWVSALSSIGYALGDSWHSMVRGFSAAGYVLLALLVVAVAIVVVHRIRLVRAEREEPIEPMVG
ncbi:MAG TPA: DedA family protein [Acidimicrobiales bacterium]|nr:DedA family protein [Acidimicrobiales bacterium]